MKQKNVINGIMKNMAFCIVEKGKRLICFLITSFNIGEVLISNSFIQPLLHFLQTFPETNDSPDCFLIDTGSGQGRLK